MASDDDRYLPPSMRWEKKRDELKRRILDAEIIDDNTLSDFLLEALDLMQPPQDPEPYNGH